jgi:hypothetical protein
MDEQYRLWGVLMFQSWLEANARGASASATEPPLASASSAAT